MLDCMISAGSALLEEVVSLNSFHCGSNIADLTTGRTNLVTSDTFGHAIRVSGKGWVPRIPSSPWLLTATRMIVGNPRVGSYD